MKKTIIYIAFLGCAFGASSQSWTPRAPDVYFSPGWCPRPEEIAELSKHLTLTMNGCCIQKGAPISPMGIPAGALSQWSSVIIQNHYPGARCDGAVMPREGTKEYENFLADQAKKEELEHLANEQQARSDRQAGLWPPQTRERCVSASISGELSKRGVTMLECVELVRTEGKKLSSELAAKGGYFVQEFGLWNVDSAGGVEPHAKFINPDKSADIKYITLQVSMYNGVGDRIRSEIGGSSTSSIRMTGPLANEDGLHEVRWDPVWYNHSAACIQVTSVRVEFMNKKTVTFAGPALKNAFHPDVVYQCGVEKKAR